MFCYLKSFDGKYISMSPNDLSTRKVFGVRSVLIFPHSFPAVSSPFSLHFQVKISESQFFSVELSAVLIGLNEASLPWIISLFLISFSLLLA